MKKPMQNMMGKARYDNLYTPDYMVRPLLFYLMDYTRLPLGTFPVVWECTDPGNSEISRLLRQDGYTVYSSDIVTGCDFLKDPPPADFHYDIVVTNPPYSLKDQFLTRCYELGTPFALLLPLTTLEGQYRGTLFDKFGLDVMVLDNRGDFTGKGANWFATAWFMWRGPGHFPNLMNFVHVDRPKKKVSKKRDPETTPLP